MFIDLRHMLERTMSGLYSDLVTRRTGKLVRSTIEQVIDAGPDERPAVIDFSSVRCVDYSCADEIIGKLLVTRGDRKYIWLSGVSEGHLEALEPVLKQRRLAVVIRDRDGRTRLLGDVPEDARRAFAVMVEEQLQGEHDLAERLAWPSTQTRNVIEELLTRRVILNDNAGFKPVTAL